MARARVATGMELEFETFGSPDDSALLLVMGFTAQLTAWPEEFCKGLAAKGFFEEHIQVTRLLQIGRAHV